MKFLKYIVACMLLLTTLLLAGCGEDKFVGKWYDRVGNVITRSDIQKDKKDDKIYRDAEYVLTYVEEKIPAGRDNNGRQIINFRYTWSDKFVMNIPFTKKDDKLYGTFKGIDFNVEYNEKNKSLLCRNSQVPLVTEAISEKNFNLVKVRDEIKADITKSFEEVKKQNNSNPFTWIVIGDIEFVDERKGPLHNG